jgi:alginate O-acetyltransferase complex protein AlgI
MLFNSHIFLLVFLPVVLTVYWSRALTPAWRLAFLTASSFVFYGYWNWRFTPLMFGVTVVSYLGGAAISRTEDRRQQARWLWATVGVLLGQLLFFKYSGMLVVTLNALADPLGSGKLPIPNVVLPIGISFHTFQALSYPIDLYRGSVRPARTFLHFAAYLSLFPQLIAGPIVRYQDIETNLRHLQERPSCRDFVTGIQLFVLGLAKKLFLADLIAERCGPLFHVPYPDFWSSWLMIASYTLQIYFDFSAYSDMAVGLGLFLGFRFPQNFNSPYKACDIQDFWRRWHMTLSKWLRDYLYVPLGGSKQGTSATVRNLTITMFLGGLWHGAAWTYVVWGLYHGVLLATFHVWKTCTVSLPRGVAHVVTFVAVSMGWVLFRATSFGFAVNWFQGLCGLNGAEAGGFLAAGRGLLVLLAVGYGIVWLAPNSFEIRTRSSPFAAVLLAVVAVCCILAVGKPSPFLYFQF